MRPSDVIQRLQSRLAALPYTFPSPLPTDLLRDARANAEEWTRFANGVTPLLHSNVVPLLEDFLAAKVQHGSAIERKLYADMTPAGLVTRMLRKRPLTFYLPSDVYLLADGTNGEGGFEKIGTDAEDSGAPGLRLEALMSYDEVAIAALLSVSNPTHFFNAGSRYNEGLPGNAGSYEPTGVYVGCVGARFERPNRGARPGQMEWAHLMVTKEQNTASNGYGASAAARAAAPERAALLAAWARFYGREHLPTYDEAAEREAQAPGSYLKMRHGWLDIDLYRRRMRATVEPFLLEANRRAAEKSSMAYVHAVGLGLGAWQVHGEQAVHAVAVYSELLHELALPHVSVVDLSYFPPGLLCEHTSHGAVFPSRNPHTRVTIYYSKRDPAAALPPAEPPHLLVAMYAWDGMSYPGNEYWLGALSASGDPAAACCSTIAVLQNPDVNPERLCGEAALVFSAAGSPDGVPLVGGGAAEAAGSSKNDECKNSAEREEGGAAPHDPMAVAAQGDDAQGEPKDAPPQRAGQGRAKRSRR